MSAADLITPMGPPSGRVYDNWTSEDFQRLNKLNLKRKLVALAMVRKGDRIDARAMMAREVWKENTFRVAGWVVRPADCVNAERPPFRPLRVQIEEQCGEVLA